MLKTPESPYILLTEKNFGVHQTKKKILNPRFRGEKLSHIKYLWKM